MATSDTTGDDIKFMIELATQELAYHKEQTHKWETTLARLQSTQKNHATQNNAYKTQIQGLELELSKAKTTGGAAGGPTTVKAAAVATSFNTPVSRQPFSTRPSLVVGQTQTSAAAAAAAPVVEKKPKLIAKALYKYDGMPDNNVMALAEGEFLIVLNAQGDWYLCQRTHDKSEGYGPQQFAPRNYLQLVDEDVDDLPPSAPTKNTAGLTVRPAAHATLKPGQFQNAGSFGTSPNNASHSSSNSSGGGVAAMTNQFGAQAHTQPIGSSTTLSSNTPIVQRTPSVPQHSSSGMPPQSPANVTAATKTPPPFRGSVGPNAAPGVIAGSPANAAVSKGPPPFRGSVGPNSAPGAGGFQQQYPGPPPKPVASTGMPLPTCTALFDYKTEDPTLLSFSRGDSFTIVGDTTTSQWWRVKDSKGNTGFVPSNFMKKD